MSNQHQGWVGVDLDGTLAIYDRWRGVDHVGEPIPPMLNRVKKWLEEGKDVRIFTARVARELDPQCNTSAEIAAECAVTRTTIEAWCAQHLGRVLPITCIKDMHLVEFWDDRAIGLYTNTGTPRHAAPQYELYRLLCALGLPIVDGQSFDRAVTAAIAKVTPRLRNLGAAAEYLETIADFLGREMKSGRPASNDLQTAFSITSRAQNLLKF